MTFEPDESPLPELDELVANVRRNPALVGDDAIVARSAAAAVERWNATSGKARRERAARRSMSRIVAGFGAGVVLVGAVLVTVTMRGRTPDAAPVGSPDPSSALIATAAPPAAVTPPAVVRADEPSPVVALDVSALPSVAPPSAEPLQPRPAPSPSFSSSSQRTPRATQETQRTAAELFALANEARRARDADSASSLYRELQRAYPSSAEAVLSFVTFGRFELDRGRASAALAQFDRYLATHTAELREDALVGRASALENLGRSVEEARAWDLLLAEFPQTLLASHAKQRLAAIR